MKRTSRELKALAREALLGQYGSLIGAMFLLGIFSALLESIPVMITRNREDTTSLIIQFIVTLIVSILTYLLQIGLLTMVMRMTRRQPYSLSDLFYAFRIHPDRFIIVSAIQIGITMLLQIPAYLVMAFGNFDLLSRTLLYLLLIMASAIVSFIILLGFTLCEMLLIDNESLGAIDAIRQSLALMHGNKGRYFYIQLSFIGLSLLSILTLGIGMLWLYPYMTTTQACFYLDVTGELDHPHYNQTTDSYTRYGTGYDNTYGSGYGNDSSYSSGYGNGSSYSYGNDTSSGSSYGSDASHTSNDGDTGSYTYGEDNRYE